MSDATLTTGVIWPKRDPGLYHVFRLPDALPGGYCFDGGKSVTMQLVDWFGTSLDWEPSLPEVAEWVRKKRYAKDGGTFLVLRNNGQSIVVGGEE